MSYAAPFTMYCPTVSLGGPEKGEELSRRYCDCLGTVATVPHTFPTISTNITVRRHKNNNNTQRTQGEGVRTIDYVNQCAPQRAVVACRCP